MSAEPVLVHVYSAQLRYDQLKAAARVYRHGREIRSKCYNQCLNFVNAMQLVEMRRVTHGSVVSEGVEEGCLVFTSIKDFGHHSSPFFGG